MAENRASGQGRWRIERGFKWRLALRNRIEDVAVAPGNFDGTGLRDKGRQCREGLGAADQISRIIEEVRGEGIFAKTAARITGEGVPVPEERQGCFCLRRRRAGRKKQGDQNEGSHIKFHFIYIC